MKTRATDSPVEADRIRRARSEGRKRTIVMAVVISGLVSLFIGRAIEVAGYNDQVERSRKNCVLTMADRRLERDDLRHRADRILGNPKAKPPVPPADFSKPPFDVFRGVKGLVVLQAQDQRRLAQAKHETLEDCKKVHPKRRLPWPMEIVL